MLRQQFYTCEQVKYDLKFKKNGVVLYFNVKE